MQTIRPPYAETTEQHQESRLGSLGFVLMLALAFALLSRFAGPPHLPPSLPSASTAVQTLRGSDIPVEALGYLLTTLGWILWCWIVVTLVVNVVIGLAEKVTRGAAWVRSLRVVSDRLTARFIRRAADGMLATVVVVNLVGRPAMSAVAAPLPSPAAMSVQHQGAPRADLPTVAPREDQGGVHYTVQPGDNLFDIAQRFYGTGYEYKRIVAANIDRRMPDGQLFTRSAVIYPGWILLIPTPSDAVETDAGQTTYVVEEGDSLRGIAARFLGDEMRWPEIYQLNQGTARLDDGRTLTHPDLIWSGLRLTLPVVAPELTDSRPPVAPPPEQRVQQPAPTPPTPTSPAPIPPAQAITPEVPVPTPPVPQPTAIIPVVTATPASTHVASTAPPETIAPPPATPGAPDDSFARILKMGAGLAAVGVTGVTYIGGRRYFRSLYGRPVSVPGAVEYKIRNGYVDAAFARTLAHRVQGSKRDPATALAGHIQAILDEAQLTSVAIVMMIYGFKEATITFRCGLAEQDLLLALAKDIGARTGGEARASVTADLDVLLELTRIQTLTLSTLEVDPQTLAPPLVPIGVRPNGDTFLVNWREIGHVLVAGEPGGGEETVLASLVTALAARCGPDEVRLWTIANRRVLPAEMRSLPHLACPRIDPDDEDGIRTVLATLRDALSQRMRQHESGAETATEAETEAPDGTPPTSPLLVLVVGELADLPDDGTTFEMLATYGAAHGIHILSATNKPDAILDRLPLMDTRLILSTADEEQSIQLLGIPDAVDLGGGGDMFVRISGRAPLHARGFRVAPSHLERLLWLMHEAYGTPPHQPDPESESSLEDDLDDDASDEVNPMPQSERERAVVALHEEPPTIVPRSDPTAMDRAADVKDIRAEGEGHTTGQHGEAHGSPVSLGVDDSDVTDLARHTNGHAAERDMPFQHPTSDAAVEEEQESHTNGYAREADTSSPSITANGTVQEAREHHTNGHTEEADVPREPVAANGTVQADVAYHTNGETVEPVLAPIDALVADTGEPSEEQPQTLPRVNIRCFGTLAVTSGDRTLSAIGKSGPQYTPWEVLVCLAVQPHGVISKERLVQTLWPDASIEKTNKRLSVTLVRLRALLAEQVPGLSSEIIQWHRDGTYHLNTQIVSSDVHVFWELCQAIRTQAPEQQQKTAQRIFALYRGALLADARAAYPWIDERQENGMSLREQYLQAFCRVVSWLARSYVKQGEPALAIPLYKAVVQADPGRESAVRSLYRCYQQVGDRAALVRDHQSLKLVLRELYRDRDDPTAHPDVYQLEPETVALYEAVLAEMDAAARTGDLTQERTGEHNN